MLAGLTLAFGLPLLSATRAVILSVVRHRRCWSALNFWLYPGAGLVLPLAAALVMASPPSR